jgi:integrase
MAVATPLRRPNSELRSREFLAPAEVGELVEDAERNRWGDRNAAIILLCYRHALRASELVDLRWSQVTSTVAGFMCGVTPV